MLLERIRSIHDLDPVQGVPRITAELNDGADPEQRINHKRVARVMAAAGLAGYVKKRKHRTTIPEPVAQVVPDLHGSVYTSWAYAELCAELGVLQSMGAIGSSADNAMSESFNASLKREVLQDTECFEDAAACRTRLFRWLTRYYTRRRHSWCGYQSPNTFEAAYADTLAAVA